MIQLTTTVGVIYIRKNAVTVISAAKRSDHKETVVKSQLWVSGQDAPFNILEDVETVYRKLTL